MRTSRRSAALAVLTAATLAFGASAASAAITLREDGTTIVLEDADLSNETVIGIEGDKLTVQNTDGSGFGILDYPAGACDFSAGSSDKIECPAASFGAIQATYAAGNDSFRLYQVCVPTVTINLGGGTNTFTGEGCEGTIATVTGGSGQDSLGGSYDGTATERLFGGGGDDRLQPGAGDDEVHAGDGSDLVDGGPGNDRLFGEGGDDRLTGRAGNDTEDGGPGDDTVGFSDGGIGEDDDQGADDVRGGDGSDKLTLEDHTGGMTISLDDQKNDGSGGGGEGDNIHTDFELIYGTDANDVFFGTAGHDDFSGYSGNDEIHGAGGDDNLSGSTGDDRLFGDGGNDKVQGYEGSDMVDGGPGTDELYGDRGSCSFFCQSDADQLFARDGERDTVDCGGGADSAVVDGLDIVAFCASVDRQNLPGTVGPPAGGAGAASPLVVGTSIKIKTLVKRGLVLRYRCAAACKVVATLSYKGKKLGAGRKTLRRAGTARVVVKIAKKSRAKVRRLKGKKLTLRVKVTSKRKTTTLTRKVKLKR